jgi:hypothetical protein
MPAEVPVSEGRARQARKRLFHCLAPTKHDTVPGGPELRLRRDMRRAWLVVVSSPDIGTQVWSCKAVKGPAARSSTPPLLAARTETARRESCAEIERVGGNHVRCSHDKCCVVVRGHRVWTTGGEMPKVVPYPWNPSWCNPATTRCLTWPKSTSRLLIS